MKARMAGIPVYTVANKDNDFVLVTGEACSSLTWMRYADVASCITLKADVLCRHKETRSSWDCSSFVNQMQKRL